MDAHAIIILPTYNEAENIANAVAGIHAYVPADILIVDDNSPDGTGDIADQLAANDPRVHVLHRAEKNGLGGAYLAGFAWALDRDYHYILEMDADGSHQPKYLPALLDAAQTADLVLGSRWVPGGGAEDWPKHREALSRGGSLYARMMLGIPVHDVTGGYRVYKADTLRAIDLPTVQSQGYCFQIDLARRVHDAGLTIKEVPIVFVERTAGQSKMDSSIVTEALKRVTVWGWERRFPRKSRHDDLR